MLRHARVIRVRGIVQGVGFRPFTYRLAHRFGVTGWVKNGSDGVEMYVEADDATLDAFVRALEEEAPPAARIAGIRSDPALPAPFDSFEIRETAAAGSPTVRISPDLATCDACLCDLFDERNRRFRYPYVNCTDCGPRYSIVTALPYDRPNTTMAPWPMCEACEREYHDPFDRRFHAQPIACPRCGPDVVLEWGDDPAPRGYAAIEAAAFALRAGGIVALKGIGGYLVACDAANGATVERLRARKYRKERPFALMAPDVATARSLVALDADGEAALASPARPIVLGDARASFEGVAPDNRELGVMLPSTPLHHLLFAAGAPRVLVATSGNRSNEPIAFEDDDARARLLGVADLLLAGERRIARRLDDSLVRAGRGASQIYRFARGFAPAAVARIDSKAPILAVGADLKNAVALAVDGQVFMSQHIGDLEYRSAREACESAIADLCATYGVSLDEALVVHDAHPQYVSTAIAADLPGRTIAVQHHRAHVASVLAEREAYDAQVVGVAFDGTGFGDDGSIWGGEIFTGSVRTGFERVAHLRPVPLPGGDAAARFPVQAAAGFLHGLDLPELENAPFHFDARYAEARKLVAKNVRCFVTTSIGRLFDTVAALLGFTREVAFEAQAALWLEHLAASVATAATLEFDLDAGMLDPRRLLYEIAHARRRGIAAHELARGFHLALARAVVRIANERASLPVVCSGGVFANRVLCEQLQAMLGERLWLNRVVPPSDGGIALGQVALAAHIARGA